MSSRIRFESGTCYWFSGKGLFQQTLSSTEAEYVAVSEVCSEILFVKQVLEFLGVKIKTPIIVKVDNIGAIYLANSATTSTRTKHVDARYHFVREFVEDGILQIIFVKSEENIADIFTKNLSQEGHEKHSEELVTKMTGT